MFTAIPLVGFRQTINLFSLAGLAIAIGEIADATIVIVENCTAELSMHGSVTRAEKQEILVRSIASVTKPLLFSLLIILASFLPVFFLEQREARLFDPLAYSKTFAMAFSTLLTLLLLPVIVVWIFKGDTVARKDFRESLAIRAYRSTLRTVIRYRYAFTAVGMLVLIPAAVLLVRFPKDFLPDIDEGSILYMPTTLPGLPNREAGWILQQMDKKLKALPEVDRVFGKIGRADTSTDPAPLTMIETTVLLKPKSTWRKGMTKEKLVAEMDKAAETIGYVNAWVQPVRARVMMQSTGIQTPVGIKVKGAEVSVIEDISQQIERLLRGLPGTKSVIAERISEGYYVDVRNDLERMAAHGVTVDEAMATVRYAIGGDNIVGVKQPDKTIIPLAVQYSPEYIDTLDKLKNTPVVTGDGRSVPLGDIADVSVRKLPEMIRNDNGSLAGYIYVDIQNVTGPDYVDSAQKFLAKNLMLPNGLHRRMDRALRVRRRGACPAAAGRTVHAHHHFRTARGRVQIRVRKRAHPAVGAVCDGRGRVSAVDAGLPDDDGGDRRATSRSLPWRCRPGSSWSSSSGPPSITGRRGSRTSTPSSMDRRRGCVRS